MNARWRSPRVAAAGAALLVALTAGSASAYVEPIYGCPPVETAEPTPTDAAPNVGAGAWLYVGIGGCYDWGVDPPYEGPSYENEAAAAAADPAPAPAVAVPLPTWRNVYDWPNGHGYVGWRDATSSSSLYGLQPNLGGNPGLWIWPRGGDYPDGGYAEWSYTAPGTTRISNVQLNFAYRNKLLAHHCIAVGLRTGTTTIAQNEWCTPARPPDSQRDVAVSLVDPSTNPTSKVLFFRVRMDCKNTPGCTKHIPAHDPLTTGGYARLKFVDMTLVDDDLPVVTPSGSFWELDENYSNGRVSYDLTVASQDAGAGIERSWVDRVNAGTLVLSNAPCDRTHHTTALDTRICPESHSFATQVDTNPFPEGTNRFVAKAIDPALNTGQSDVWTVYIDRTPPSAPANLALQGFDRELGIGTFGWSESSDPPLPDGVPGSGVRTYDVRYAIGGGSFTDWFSPDDTSVDIGALHSGTTVTVEVRAVDRVGNASGISSVTATMPTTSTPRGPVITGRLVDGNGSGVAGEVSIYLDRVDETQLPVGSVETAGDGSFRLRVSPASASAVASEALTNGGWVNFDVTASDGRLFFNGPVARKIGLSGWSDGDGDPAPMTIVLAAGARGIASVGGSFLSLGGVQRTGQIGIGVCTQFKFAIAQDERFATIGELHTGSDQHAYFEYGQRADSHVEVGVSSDGINWRGNGSVHVQTSTGSGNEAGIRFNARSNFGRLLRSKFRFVKYRRILACPFVSITSFEIRATRWLGESDLGADVRQFDDQCLSTYFQFRAQFAPGTDAWRRSNRAHTFGGGVSVFGISLDIRSGFSKWVESRWFFGRRLNAYWLCGNNAKYLEATRIFAGA
jgi:hypothetical protein